MKYILIFTIILLAQTKVYAQIKNQWELCYDSAYEDEFQKLSDSGKRQYGFVNDINGRRISKRLEEDSKANAEKYCVEERHLLAPESDDEKIPEGALRSREVPSSEANQEPNSED